MLDANRQMEVHVDDEIERFDPRRSRVGHTAPPSDQDALGSARWATDKETYPRLKWDMSGFAQTENGLVTGASKGQIWLGETHRPRVSSYRVSG